MDCIVHGVAKCRTRLSNFHFHIVSGVTPIMVTIKNNTRKFPKYPLGGDTALVETLLTKISLSTERQIYIPRKDYWKPLLLLFRASLFV